MKAIGFADRFHPKLDFRALSEKYCYRTHVELMSCGKITRLGEGLV
jgi:hypothetical protein